MDDMAAYRSLIAEVYELAGESRRSSEALAREQGQTAARWHVLSVLSDGPRTVATAARRLGLARQSVQRVVDDLVDASQLQLHDNPDHVRAPIVALTDRGRATLDALVRRGDADRHAALARAALGREQLDHARAVLHRLTAALRAAADTTWPKGQHRVGADAPHRPGGPRPARGTLTSGIAQTHPPAVDGKADGEILVPST